MENRNEFWQLKQMLWYLEPIERQKGITKRPICILVNPMFRYKLIEKVFKIEGLVMDNHTGLFKLNDIPFNFSLIIPDGSFEICYGHSSIIS